MASPLKNVPLYTNSGHTLTPLENAFISAYLIHKNGARAVVEAGYKTKSPRQQANALLSRDYVAQEISYRIQQEEDAKVAKRSEILQFYTSVMRGEVLDQFGIEAALDTRIKAANELAKHMIELPMKLEQKNITNNIGNITLNFIPRHDDDVIDMD